MHASRPQFSLAAMMVVVTAVCVVLAVGVPAFKAAQSIHWADPVLGYCFGFAGLILASLLAVGLLRR